jgi:hypothetical protein
MWRGWFGAAVVVLGAGCGKTASHSAGASGADESVAAAADLATWIYARARAECEQDARCFDGTARRYTSTEACLDETLAYVGETPYSNGFDNFADLAAVYEVPSAEAQAACLSWLAQCHGVTTGVCRDILQPRRTVQRDGACGSRDGHHVSPCAGGLSCVWGACLTCQPWAQEGQDCGYLDCAPKLTCHHETRLLGDVVYDGPSYCVHASQLGEACQDGSCDNGLVCFNDICRAPANLGEACAVSNCQPPLQCTLNVCQPPPAILGEGEPCGEGPRSCAVDLTCAGGRCQALGDDGAICSRATSSSLPRCRRWCVFDTADAVEGRCSDTPPPTKAPTPCSLYRRELQLACPFGTHADFQGAAPPYPQLAAYCQCLPGAEPTAGAAACE